MKKIQVMLCALLVCLLTACDEFRGVSHLEPKTRYEWSYTKDGTTSTGTFTTNEYGQASFPAPDDTDCTGVELKKMDSPSFEEDAGLFARAGRNPSGKNTIWESTRRIRSVAQVTRT